jgi:hypothetical protein
MQKNCMFHTVPPCRVAASLDYNTAQVQGPEADPVSKAKSGGQRGSTKGPDEEDSHCSSY